MGLGWGRSIRFVFNAAAAGKGFKKSSWMLVCFLGPVRALYSYLCLCMSLPAAASVASCGAKVKGWWISWNRQEATSVVWRLTRMDCMTDAHEVHLGCPGQAVRSAGVRSAPQPNQLEPSFWLECNLSRFKSHKTPLPFLLSAPQNLWWRIFPLVCMVQERHRDAATVG